MNVYTDGSCLGNPGPGGWACIFPDGTKLCGGESLTTNNRMELTAAISTLEKNPHVTVYTDSRYVMDGIEKWIKGWKLRGWKSSTGTPVKNQELWKQLDQLVTPQTKWQWVRAHTGNPGNEQADTLARSCANLVSS